MENGEQYKTTLTTVETESKTVVPALGRQKASKFATVYYTPTLDATKIGTKFDLNLEDFNLVLYPGTNQEGKPINYRWLYPL